ncbi:MAG: PG0541 family transporter-associated protein [Bacteroidales bacterium]
MKAVFISFNQAVRDDITLIFDELGIIGFSFWEETQGRGSHTGESHFGTHAWPTLNSSILTMVPAEKTEELLSLLRSLDKRNELLGLRAFVWNIEATI